jgi:predicted SAM-dependent methyltransferase
VVPKGARYLSVVLLDQVRSSFGKLVPPRKGKGPQGPRQILDASKALHLKAFGQSVCDKRELLAIGAGRWSHPFWKNLDILQDQYEGNPPDIVHDLMSKKPIAIPSECLAAAYCSHVIEHIDDDADLVLFQEVHRALRPGGVFRLVFPDVDVAFRAYSAGDRSLFIDNWPRKGNGRRAKAPLITLFVEYFAYHRVEANVKERLPGHVTYSASELEEALTRALAASNVDAFYDQLTRDLPEGYQRLNPGCHRNWWNVPKLQRHLAEAGFRHVHASAYLQSRALALRDGSFFDRTHPHFSGYVEAIK